MLRRLATFAVHHKRLMVLGIWLPLTILIVVGSTTIGSNFRTEMAMPSSEARQAEEMLSSVQSGDAEWKEFFIVNLLNLPNHYHNGGIWPFIGSLWVRFIHKLGMSSLAVKELIRLAKINKMGFDKKWAVARPGEPKHNYQSNGRCAYCGCTAHA